MNPSGVTGDHRVLHYLAGGDRPEVNRGHGLAGRSRRAQSPDRVRRDSESMPAPGDIEEALRWLWRDENAPALLRVQIDTDTGCFPNVPFGAPIMMMESQRRDHD
jgi:hypothetical protein